MERGRKLVEYLEKSSYVDAKKHACVLCGSEKVTDWWMHDGNIGPYCGTCSR
jgi:hypothetical protein